MLVWCVVNAKWCKRVVVRGKVWRDMCAFRCPFPRDRMMMCFNAAAMIWGGSATIGLKFVWFCNFIIE